MIIKKQKKFKSGNKEVLYRTGDDEFKGSRMRWYYDSKAEAQRNAKKLRKEGYNVRIWSHVLWRKPEKKYSHREYVLYRKIRKTTVKKNLEIKKLLRGIERTETKMDDLIESSRHISEEHNPEEMRTLERSIREAGKKQDVYQKRVKKLSGKEWYNI
jgi:hypothetical protein